MRLFKYCTLSFFALTFCSVLSSLQAQGDRVRFETYDGVEIHGRFYGSNKGRKAPAVICLHQFGGKKTDGGWDGLAQALQKAGCSVLTFDFRGHGDSTSVDAEKFLQFIPHRKGIRGGARMPKVISHKDFASSYVPYLINDIIAAKTFLEKKNDANECNASNIIVIGAEEGATLGMAWVASETLRYKYANQFKLEQKPQSEDIVGAVWITPRARMKPRGASVLGPMVRWLKATGITHRIPMLFVYGEKDEAANKGALKLVRYIRPNYKRGKKFADKNNLTETGDYGVSDVKNLAGAKLLDADLPARKFIVETYFDKNLRTKHAINAWEERKTDNFPYHWTSNPKILPRLPNAKNPNEKHIWYMPLRMIGLSQLHSLANGKR